MEIDSNRVDVLTAKALTLSALEKFDEALEYCDKDLELDLNYSDTWYVKGNIFWNLEK